MGEPLVISMAATHAIKKKGSSVVDYLIVPYKNFGSIKHFKIGQYTPLLSDHCPIMATISLDNKLTCEKSIEVEMSDLPKRVQWDENHLNTFREKLASEQYKEQVTKLLDQEVVTVEEVKAMLLEVDQQPTSEPLKKNKKKKERHDQPWFDNECRSLKREITECGKTLRSAPHSTSIREKIYCLKKTLRNSLRKKKHAFQSSVVEEMCQDMSNGDKKKYWRQLKRLEGSKDDNKYIPDYTLINHFKEILYDDEIKLKYQNGTQGNGDLDYEITEEELLKAAKILKLGKGIGIDNLYNEMIRPLVDIYPKLVVRIFNDILSKRQQIGADWLHSLVTAVHKKGDKEDPDNYRGISLMSCMGKFFLTVINNRLTEFCLHKGLLSPSQLGFVKGNRTSDPHIILHNVLQHYCHKSKKRLYGCFVDFSKAFDSVPRDILLDKLKNQGINGNVYDIIQTIYLEDTVSIKISNKHSTSFKTNRGVRQGCVLSPILFNLFLADLQPVLDKYGENIKIDETVNTSCLLWADDILIISETMAGLQQKLTALQGYCDINKLSVNTKKTQCMIFNKTGKLLKNHTFTYKNTKLECVREYKYLGFIVTPSGEVRTGLEDLRKRGLRAFMKMKSTLGVLFRNNIHNSIHLYNYLVKPILTYCSDFWGSIQPKNNPITKTHLMFCKHLLGVRRQTCTEGVLQELGMTPITNCAIKNVVKNWERIEKGNANTLLMSSHVYSKNNNTLWATNIKKIFIINGMLQEYLDKVNETEETRKGPLAIKLLRRLTDQYHQSSFSAIQSTSKLKVLNLLKTLPGTEPYLTEVTNSKHRSAMTKLRLSSHRLEIETGRYTKPKTDREERFCAFCKFKGKKVVEDEIHFLLACPMYDEIRENLLPSQKLNNHVWATEEKFVQIMSDFDNIKATAKYIYLAFAERQIKLDVLNTLQDLVSSAESLLKNPNPDPGPIFKITNISQDGMKLTLSRT